MGLLARSRAPSLGSLFLFSCQVMGSAVCPVPQSDDHRAMRAGLQKFQCDHLSLPGMRSAGSRADSLAVVRCPRKSPARAGLRASIRDGVVQNPPVRFCGPECPNLGRLLRARTILRVASPRPGSPVPASPAPHAASDEHWSIICSAKSRAAFARARHCSGSQ